MYFISRALIITGLDIGNRIKNKYWNSNWSKGQTISKANYSFLNSSKKQTKLTNLTMAFEIYWPLESWICQPFTTLAIANSCMKSRESASLLHTYLGCVGVDVHRFHFLLGSELNLFLSWRRLVVLSSSIFLFGGVQKLHNLESFYVHF